MFRAFSEITVENQHQSHDLRWREVEGLMQLPSLPVQTVHFLLAGRQTAVFFLSSQGPWDPPSGGPCCKE